MPAPTELATIRALSQYRPFEGRGESARDAQEDLVLAALAEANGEVDSTGECCGHLRTLFRLDFEEVAVAAAINRLLKKGSVLKLPSGGYSLSANERTRLEAVASESQETAEIALAEWRGLLAERWPLTTAQLDELQASLQVYLKTVMRRHGLEASLLLLQPFGALGRPRSG